jgi:hypothetical protein
MSAAEKILILIKNDFKFLLHLITRLDPMDQHVPAAIDFFDGIVSGKKKLEKVSQRINAYFKEGDKGKKITHPHEHDWIPGINEDDLSLFNSDVDFLPDLPISYIVGKRSHQTLCWMYFRSICYLTDMYLMKVLQQNGNTSSEVEQKYDKARTEFKKCLIERSEYEHFHDIGSIIDKELLSDKKRKMEDAAKAAQKVKELFNGNTKSDKVIGTIVDSLAKKLSSMDDDDDNGILGLVNIAREVAMDVGAEVRSQDVDMDDLMKRSREAGTKVYQNTSEEEKAKLKSNPMMRDLVKNLEDPEREVSMEELQDLIQKHGIDPMTAARQLGMENEIMNMQKQMESDQGATVSIEEAMLQQLKLRKK